MSDPIHLPLPVEQLRSIDSPCDAFEEAWQQGQQPRIEDYLAGVAGELRPLLRMELIRMDLEWRCRSGLEPVLASYAARFPECAGDLDAWLAEARAAAATLANEATPVATAPPTAAPDCSGLALRSEAPSTIDPAQRQPRTLGEYELLEPIGEGGMGEVWKARHRSLNRLVAVKLLPIGKDHSRETIQRFLRERQTIGPLDHPHIVEATDAGEQEGVFYLVMKLVKGTDLHRLVKERGPLPVAEACALGWQAALGLQYLQEHGLVHRDIKPSNLMVTPRGKGEHPLLESPQAAALGAAGTLQILDLGLARWRTAAPVADGLTTPGRGLGTPEFMAPEQANDAAAVDIRADLYALGGTLVYLLTGKAPFAHRTGWLEKLRAHAEEPPPDLRTLRPDVPAALADLITRLLAKRPEDRSQTPAEVAAQLAGFVVLEPAVGQSSRPDQPATRLPQSLFQKREGEAPAEPLAVGNPARQEPHLPEIRPSGTDSQEAVVEAVLPDGSSVKVKVCPPSGRAEKVTVAVDDFVRKRSRRRRVRITVTLVLSFVLASLLGLEVLQYHRAELAQRRADQHAAPAPPTAIPLFVQRFEVKHFATVVRDGQRFAAPRGVLGLDSFAARLDDSVTLEAQLSRADYAFLIAYRPDGTEELCFPESEDEPPPLSDRPRYPMSLSRGKDYALTEGVGLQVFAVVVSDRPLPAYRQWREQLGPSPWGRYPTPPGVVWYDDGAFVEARTAQNRDRSERGKGRDMAGKAQVVAQLDWLRRAPEVRSAAAVGFAVLPKEKP